MYRPAQLRCFIPALAAATLSLAAACGDNAPTAPATMDPAGTFQSSLAASGGSGTGGVSVTPSAIADGYFNARIRVRLHGAKPNASFIVQRAPEIGRTNGSDGICQRAQSIAPWSPSDPAAASFVTFTPPFSTVPITITTTAAGEGAVDFDFSAATIPAGTKFDVMFRLVDDLSTPVNTFSSGCFTVTVL